jgi:hypothetical protein
MPLQRRGDIKQDYLNPADGSADDHHSERDAAHQYCWVVEYPGDSGYLDHVFRPSNKDFLGSPDSHSYIWFLNVQACSDRPKSLYLRWRVYDGRQGEGMFDSDRDDL